MSNVRRRMHALEVQRNGVTLAVVGASNALMFSADISATVEEEAATIDVRGMLDLGSERRSHVSWLALEPLRIGDLLSFRFFESETVTVPVEEVATDSEEHLTGQAEYEELLRSNPMVPRQLDINQPNATLQLRVAGDRQVIATLEAGREFIAFRILWNQWRPERCRLSLSSFSQQEALDRTGSREWFQGTLRVGEQCAVKVGA
jgi:hypothetical protein